MLNIGRSGIVKRVTSASRLFLAPSVGVQSFNSAGWLQPLVAQGDSSLSKNRFLVRQCMQFFEEDVPLIKRLQRRRMPVTCAQLVHDTCQRLDHLRDGLVQ